MPRSPLGAQESPPSSTDPRAYATAGISTTRVAGRWVPQAGGTLALRLGRRIEIGGAARFDLAAPTIVREGSRVRLHFGYAGVAIGVFPAPARWPDLRIGALLGGANASVSDPAVGTLFDSDNGIVVEPSAEYGRQLGARLHAAGSVGWRFADGFSLLGGIRSRDLRGPSVGLSLSVGPF